jgi:serine/threonine protein kinase
MRTIAHFEVLDKLGAGGMGEVFKARDTRLNRFVALKFLPESATPDARERFQREALAIAALSHPNICALYEIGDDQGRPFLVLELLEGESLRARLAKGPLPPAQLLDWGAQIAEALDAAHKRGVLHRDLKPDNIFVLPGGHIKVLDFGLARLETGPQSSGSNDRTLTSPGVTLGTVPYMSPEQAKGEPLDARSDIFSFGSVFYEMASGRQAFPPRSAAETIAAILKDQPPSLRKARPELAPKLEEIAVRCLEKDPDLRYQSAADLRSELRRLSRIGATQSSAAEEPLSAEPPASAPSSASSASHAPLSDSQIVSGLLRRHWRWPVLAVFALAAAAFAVWRFLPRTQSNAAPPHLQFRQLTYSGQVLDAVLSPDGKFLVHVDNSPQGTSLHLMSVANGSDAVIVPPSAACCWSPSFSPDGSLITFIEGRTLKTVPVLGGAVNTLATQACSAAAFSPGGRRIAYVGSTAKSTQLVLANRDGSGARALQAPPTGDGYISQCYGGAGAVTHAPAWSPDGKWIALDLAQQNQITRIEVISTADGHVLDLGANLNVAAADVAWLPGGRDLVFTAPIPASAPPQLWEMAFPSGHLTQLTSDVQGYNDVSVAANGELTLVHAAPQFSIWTQARSGGALQQLPGGGADLDGVAGLAWTPQGAIDSLRNYGGQAQIWSASPGGSGAHRLGDVTLPNSTFDLQAAPDGDLFVSAIYSTDSVWRIHADGSGLTEMVHPAPGAQASFPALVRGGGAVAYWYAEKNSDQTLWTVPVGGGPPRQLWTGYIFADGNPASPDGSRIFAFTEGPDQSHQGVVLTLSPAPGNAPPLVTHIGLDYFTTTQPYGWTADGRAITYLKRTGSLDNIWAFPIAGGKPYVVTHFKKMNIAAYAFAKDGRLAVSRGSQNSDVVLVTGLSSKPH